MEEGGSTAGEEARRDHSKEAVQDVMQGEPVGAGNGSSGTAAGSVGVEAEGGSTQDAGEVEGGSAGAGEAADVSIGPVAVEEGGDDTGGGGGARGKP